MASSPRILNRPTDGHRASPRSQFIIAPRAQAPRRCETQASLGGKPPSCYRFDPLTPFARSAHLIAGDGTKNGFPLRIQNRQKPKNECLTGKAPYKCLTGKAPYRFESTSLQRRVWCEPDFLRLRGLPASGITGAQGV